MGRMKLMHINTDAIRLIITARHCIAKQLAHPVVYASSSPPPSNGSCVDDTNASSVARIGVLQGDATNAKVRPAMYACEDRCIQVVSTPSKAFAMAPGVRHSEVISILAASDGSPAAKLSGHSRGHIPAPRPGKCRCRCSCDCVTLFRLR